MKKCLSGISVVVILMIVLSSIIQFHHHDDKGDIIFAVSALCHHENNHEKHEHGGISANCCHCEHDEHNCSAGNECSAHLGDYQATKQTSITIDSHPTLLLFAVLCEPNFNIHNTLYSSENKLIDEALKIQSEVISSIGLRAPPHC